MNICFPRKLAAPYHHGQTTWFIKLQLPSSGGVLRAIHCTGECAIPIISAGRAIVCTTQTDEPPLTGPRLMLVHTLS